jgi:hypothetical protein
LFEHVNHVNKRKRKPKGQSRMGNLKKLEAWGTQDTLRRQKQLINTHTHTHTHTQRKLKT